MNRKKLLITWNVAVISCLVVVAIWIYQYSEHRRRAIAEMRQVPLNDIVPDSRLGVRIKPGSPGLDANGWRNPSVLDHADIVAIGDSQTWGINAQITETWPAVLGSLTGKSIYNFSLGGYGPPQYELLMDDALALHPDTIIVALYMGNDLYDGYASTKPNPDTILPRLPDATQDATYTDEPRTAFTVRYRTIALDLADSAIQIGLNVDLVKMDEIAIKARHIHLIFVVIPTKESAYAELMTDDAYPYLLKQEQRVRDAIMEHCNLLNVPCIDVLPAFRQALAQKIAIYPDSDDGHPLPTGYSIIAKTIYAEIRAE